MPAETGARANRRYVSASKHDRFLVSILPSDDARSHRADQPFTLAVHTTLLSLARSGEQQSRSFHFVNVEVGVRWLRNSDSFFTEKEH